MKFYSVNNDNEMPEIGDLVIIDVTQKLADSVLFTSKGSDIPFEMIIEEPSFVGDIMSALLSMHLNDHVSLIFPVDSLFLSIGENLPSFIEPGTITEMDIILNKIIKKDVLEEEMRNENERRKAWEESVLEPYYNNDNYVITEDSLIVVDINKGKGRFAKAGDIMKVYFMFQTLEGDTLLDFNTGKPYELVFGDMALGQGFYEGLSLVAKGGEAEFIIPSSLAWGEEGFQGTILPYTPFKFNLKASEVDRSNLIVADAPGMETGGIVIIPWSFNNINENTNAKSLSDKLYNYFENKPDIIKIPKKLKEPKAVEDLRTKDDRSDIFNAITGVLKSKNPVHVREALRVDEDPTLVMEYIAENIPREYTNKNEIKKAYENIAQADLYFGRARSSRNYGYWKYASDFMGIGVSSSKKETYKKFSKIQTPTIFTLMGRNRGKRNLRDAIAGKMSERMHISNAVAISMFPYLEIMFQNDELAWEISDFLELEENEIKRFRKKKIPKKVITKMEKQKAQMRVEERDRRFEELQNQMMAAPQEIELETEEVIEEKPLIEPEEITKEAVEEIKQLENVYDATSLIL